MSYSPIGANDTWQRRSVHHIWHPCTQMQRALKAPPLPISRGEGPWLYDYEGKRYFDAASSWWVNLFGHADPRISTALKDQIDRLPHVMLAGCTHAPAGSIIGAHCSFIEAWIVLACGSDKP